MPENLFDLTGKFAFITGATKGIGRAIAEAFVDHGATIALTSRKADQAEAVAAEVNARVGRDAAIGLAADLADLPGLIASYDAAIARFGRIDVLVCNAAAVPEGFGGAADFPVEEYRRFMDCNIVNNAQLMLHAAVAMKARRDGVILATSSAGGLRASYGVSPYGVSKAGLCSLVRNLGAEFAPYNVRVNAIAPGLTMSYSLGEAIKAHPDVIEQYRLGSPLQRIVQPEEVAAGMVMLATAAGRSITGQTIAIDAGEPGSGSPPAV